MISPTAAVLMSNAGLAAKAADQIRHALRGRMLLHLRLLLAASHKLVLRQHASQPHRQSWYCCTVHSKASMCMLHHYIFDLYTF